MKRLALAILFALLSFTTAANADGIAIGQLSYLGVSCVRQISCPHCGGFMLDRNARMFRVMSRSGKRSGELVC
jgi:hypothetical protein